LALAFAVLLLPAILNLSFVAVARLSYPRPQDLESSPPNVAGQGLPRLYWVYLIGASLVAAGFADFPVIAFHFEKADVRANGSLSFMRWLWASAGPHH
jgi:hypothetical protein